MYRLASPQACHVDEAGSGWRVLPDEVERKRREPEIGTTLLHATALPMFEEAATPGCCSTGTASSSSPIGAHACPRRPIG